MAPASGHQAENSGARLLQVMVMAGGVDGNVGINKVHRAHGRPPTRGRWCRGPADLPDSIRSAVQPPAGGACAGCPHRRHHRSCGAPHRRSLLPPLGPTRPVTAGIRCSIVHSTGLPYRPFRTVRLARTSASLCTNGVSTGSMPSPNESEAEETCVAIRLRECQGASSGNLHSSSGMMRRMNSSNIGTVKAVSPWPGLQIMPLPISLLRVGARDCT